MTYTAESRQCDGEAARIKGSDQTKGQLLGLHLEIKKWGVCMKDYKGQVAFSRCDGGTFDLVK